MAGFAFLGGLTLGFGGVASMRRSTSSGVGWVMVPHDPKFSSEEEEIAFYAAIGEFATRWSAVEITVEGILVLLKNRQGAPVKDGVFEAFPVSFSKKCDELKTHMKAQPNYEAIAKRIRPLLTEGKGLHKTRVMLLHGFCQGAWRGRLHIGTSDQKNGLAYKEQSFSLADIKAVSARMRLMHAELSELWSETQLMPHR